MPEIDIDVESLQGLRRSLAHTCLDWKERQHDIGGALGAALLAHFIRIRWLARMRGTRAVRVTFVGERGFVKVFGIRRADFPTAHPASR